MTSKFLRIFLAVAVLFTISALAQTGSTAAVPNAPSASTPAAGGASPATAVPPTTLTGTKVGTININEAVFLSNEGHRDMDTLGKKFEPKQTELKGQNDELEALKKQLSTQQDKLNDDALAKLKKDIEGKQKTFDRAVQDAQEDFQNQQREIFERILGKMAPMIVKYAQENGYGLILDKSNVWPQSPILIAGDAVDITKPVLDVYNAQSGVPAPTTTGSAKPPASKPATGTTPKPAVPKTSDTSK
jgi:Skp family chaperone for outer membrane proteins